MLASGAGALAFGSLAVSGLQAQQPQKVPIVDVHHHVAPPSYKEDLLRRKIESGRCRSGRRKGRLPTWTRPASRPRCCRSPSLVSGSATMRLRWRWRASATNTVQNWRATAKAASARLRSLPLPDVDGSLRESIRARYAQVRRLWADDELRQKWLGDAAFGPVMDELNRRKAVVYTTRCSRSARRRNLIAEVPRAVIEFGTDTTRTIQLVVRRNGGALSRHQIHLLACRRHHAVSYRAFRAAAANLERGGRQGAARRHAGVAALLLRHRAGCQSGRHGGADQIVPIEKVVFGTDFPFRTSTDHVKGLAAIFNETELRKIESDNARAILPRLKAA